MGAPFMRRRVVTANRVPPLQESLCTQSLDRLGDPLFGVRVSKGKTQGSDLLVGGEEVMGKIADGVVFEQ